MKVLCLRKLTGLCEKLNCSHGVLHEPLSGGGATCRTRPGVCALTNLITECMLLSDERIKQIQPFLEDKDEA